MGEARRRMGISPIIATLLLIVIAVASATLAYIWIISYQGTLSQQASAPQLQEKIKIEALEYSSDTLTVYVRNIGDVDVTIASAYIIAPDGTSIAMNETTTPASPGTLVSVEISGVTLSSGTTYTVKVVTRYGTEATYTWTYKS